VTYRAYFTYYRDFEFKRLEAKKIGQEQIMAYGALPPGFRTLPEGEHLWTAGKPPKHALV